jgi:hypothetical protein
VGQGDPGGQHQARLTRQFPAKYSIKRRSMPTLLEIYWFLNNVRFGSACGLKPGHYSKAEKCPTTSGAGRAPRPALRHREPAGCRYKYRHRGGRACTTGRLHAPAGRSAERDQRDALRQAQFQLHPRHCAGCGRHPRAQRFPSSSPTPRRIPAKSIWHHRATGPRPMLRASCSS